MVGVAEDVEVCVVVVGDCRFPNCGSSTKESRFILNDGPEYNKIIIKILPTCEVDLKGRIVKDCQPLQICKGGLIFKHKTQYVTRIEW